MLYPLKFTPIYKTKLWGGERLKRYARHDGGHAERVGETWDVSAIEGNESLVENGFLQGNTLDELVEVYMGDLVGDSVFQRYGNEFPLLVKLIDSAQDLSIQVHPNDAMAMEQNQPWGKNEMWYILDAAPDAAVVAGFTRPVSKDEYLQLVAENRLETVLQRIPVQKGDTIFIPAGCVHSISAGCVILEIQQTSDTTYRIYDYNRLDADGRKRELHTELAVKAIDFENWQNQKLSLEPVRDGAPERLVKCDYFTADVLALTTPQAIDLALLDSFVLLTTLEGNATVRHNGGEISLETGETTLVPAALEWVEIVPQGGKHAKVMKTYIS
jgi:mannose-6-phosphate isomerase